MTTKQNFLHAYAIVRYEMERDETTTPEFRVTVKKIVFDPNYADAEVKRLNELNQAKGAYYFSQVTRIEQPFAEREPMDHSDLVEESETESRPTAPIMARRAAHRIIGRQPGADVQLDQS